MVVGVVFVGVSVVGVFVDCDVLFGLWICCMGHHSLAKLPSLPLFVPPLPPHPPIFPRLPSLFGILVLILVTKSSPSSST